MSSLVSTIAKQAQSTFSKNIGNETFPDSFNELIQSVNKIRASDLNFDPNTMRAGGNLDPENSSASATYIPIIQNQTFTMDIYILKCGSRLPLHDHCGMHGIIKVIDGTLKITSYSSLPPLPVEGDMLQNITNKVKSCKLDSLIPVKLHKSVNVNNNDNPSVLTPTEGNFHEIVAIGGAAAFLDILAPPYKAAKTRFHFYSVLETKGSDLQSKFWLSKMPHYGEFWCKYANDYTGPKISL